MLMPWLDELETLSAEDRPVRNFYRMQTLWFNVAHVIAPFMKTSSIRMSPTQCATTWPTAPRHCRFAPLRREAQATRHGCPADSDDCIDGVGHAGDDNGDGPAYGVSTWPNEPADWAGHHPTSGG